MIRNGRTKEQVRMFRAAQQEARDYIIDEVNKFTTQEDGTRWRKPFTARHINEAIFIAKQKELVDGSVIALAGFVPPAP